MTRFTSIVFIVYGILFQNGFISTALISGRYSCFSKLFNSTDTLNKSNTTRTYNSIDNILMPPDVSPISNKSTITEHESFPKTNDDILSLFNNQTSLSKLSSTEKKSNIQILIYNGLLTPLPPVVVINLVTTLSSTNELISSFTQLEINNILTMITTNECAFYSIETKIQVQFLKEMFLLPPDVLHTIPKYIFVPIFRIICSTDTLNALPHTAVLNLITVISMSKSLFNCLPPPSISSILTFIASKPPAQILAKLTPTTVSGFIVGMLDTINNTPHLLKSNMLSSAVIAKILSPLLTSRRLSITPTDNYNLLLSILGSYPTISEALPTTNIVSIFNILTTSPIILNSVNPSYLARFIVTIINCPSIINGIPSNIINSLLNAVSTYLPSCLICIPDSEYLSLLLKSKNN